MQQVPDHDGDARLHRIQDCVVAGEANELALHLEPNDAAVSEPTDLADTSDENADNAITEPLLTQPQDDQAPADQAEFEGPRRRARRERAERRAAQARATAIEEARREAKRRARGRIVDEPKPVARGVVRGLKMLLLTVLLVIVGVGLALILYFTPVMTSARCSSLRRAISSSPGTGR